MLARLKKAQVPTWTIRDVGGRAGMTRRDDKNRICLVEAAPRALGIDEEGRAVHLDASLWRTLPTLFQRLDWRFLDTGRLNLDSKAWPALAQLGVCSFVAVTEE